MDTSIASHRPGGGQALPRIPNPRRTPFHVSKSLPRSKRQKLAHGVQDQCTDISNKPINLVQLTSQRSSSDESASQWFDKANENVPTGQERSPPTNNDSPFFLSTQQTPYPHNLDSAYGDDLFGAEHEGDGEKEELREVIDDLTVENKRLKKLLKIQRSTAQPRSKAKDRLFDLRVHGLSAERKRELELLLRNFTAQANNPASGSSSSTTLGSIDTSGNRKSNHPTWTTPPQQRSKTHLTDSGYGTQSPPNSHAGGISTAVSSGGKPAVPISSSSRNKNIKSYLHDIPDTLLPRQAPFMSERAKQILVVRRLEQLFTGKQAAPGEHSQPIQQQEVSNSAARAEAKPTPNLEGTREAYILPPHLNIALDPVDRQDTSPKDRSPNTGSTSTQPGSPDQRPTRPMDLDIQRAQIASDNIEYLRHLGLSTPHIHQTNDSSDQSWIYLNLLTGMAQLHTLNVTPAFIQKAIKKLSTKFELSEDGRRVRWRGGNQGTTLPASEERSIRVSNEATSELEEDESGSDSRRSKTNSSSNNLFSKEPSFDSALQMSGTSRLQASTSATSSLQITSLNAGSKPSSAMIYKPLIYKGKKHTGAASYLESTTSSSPSGESGDLLRMLSSSTLNKERESDAGMITYYSNPFFCSDATEDKSPINWKPQRSLMAGEGLGTKQIPHGESPVRAADACYFTPQFASKPCQENVDDFELSFEVQPISTSGEEETRPLEMEASGIGGTWPEDNFAVDVKVLRQVQNLRDDARPHTVPWTGSRKRKQYSYRTAKCEILELPPSKLPPPSYVFFTSSSSSADPEMRDSDSDASSSTDEESPAPAPFLNQWSTGSSDGESDVEEDESGSVDMLALARAADPDRVAAQEREYILNRFPCIEGSLAATVGASQSSSSAGESEVEDEDLQ